MFDRRLILNFDLLLLCAVLAVAGMGVANLYSIGSSGSQAYALHFKKQLYWIGLGLGAILVLINISYLTIIRYAYILHGCSILLLLFVLVCGQTIFGSQRWIVIAGFSLQPSELAKITLILALAKFFADNISPRPYLLRDLVLPLGILAATFVPVYIQPDLGTAGMYGIIFVSMCLFLTINRRTVAWVAASVLTCVPFTWFFLKAYQKKRIMVFLNPELDPLNAGYQVIQSKIAVGSGRLLGAGFMNGTQSQLRFLPEQHTDFVFSVWAEEWGFLGCAVLLFLMLAILYRGLAIAYSCKHFAGSYLAGGITLLLFWQVVINVCMTMGLFPVVGVPLPLFSYGGSSLLSTMIGIGLLLNVGMRKFR